jgi:hypothetical protein
VTSINSVDLEPLRAFGSLSEARGRVAVDVGGILIPGPDFTEPFNPGKEKYDSEFTSREGREEEAGRADQQRQGSRSGRSQAETAPSTGSHPVGLLSSLRHAWHGDGITEAELEELEVYYPDVRVTFSSSRLVYLGLTAQPFPSIPDRAQFALEVPRPGYARYSWPQVRIAKQACPADRIGFTWHQATFEVSPMFVPAVRVWARWIGGPLHGTNVISHHRYPDFSLCVCEPRNWLRGVHPLVDYVGMCVTSFAKILHERNLGFYPGPQHYPEWTRLARDRSNEYCGCGAFRRYGECHRQQDQTLSAQVLTERERGVRGLYYQDLRRQSRSLRPPTSAWARAPYND